MNPVLPTDPEHVLSKTLCGAVAAVGLTQIRKYAAAQAGKSLHCYSGLPVVVI